MNKEQLFRALGDVDEELLIRSEKYPAEKGLTENHSPLKNCLQQFFAPHQRRLKWAGAVTCIVLLLVAGTQILQPDQNQKKTEPRLARNEPASPASISTAASNVLADDMQTVTDESAADRPFADVNSLLTDNDGEECLKLESIQLNNKNAVYESIPSIPSNQLKVYIGEELTDTKNWYRLSGHEEHQYLICHEKKNSYSLWEFNRFEDKSYPYKEVLEEIYGIHSAQDITKILVLPAAMDNTDDGKALQKKIGTIVIDKPEELATIYDILSSLTCLGSDLWNQIGLLDDSPSAMLNAVRKGRYLTIITGQENRHINRIKYNGINHMFYENGGTAYQALKDKEAGEIERVLRIE